MPPTSGMLHVFAICLAGFDEILTLQWGASRTGRPFNLVDLSTPEEELPDPISRANPHSYKADVASAAWETPLPDPELHDQRLGRKEPALLCDQVKSR
jgi:hypothetical protein